MQGENRFIKLLLFSTAGGEVLLYGFSSPTNQPFLTWKQREISKKHQSVLTAILPFHEAEKWQLFLLAKYAQLHPGAEKTLKWLKEWRTRLPNIANEESGTNLTGS